MNLSKSYDYFQPEKNDCRIHIVGCGSVGANVASQLARSGITKFTLWDFDEVEPKNLANQVFRHKDIGKPKVEALKDILTDINPDIEADIKLKPKGWDGQMLNGYVFLAVDNIDLRRRIVEMHMDNQYVKAMFDFRTRLEDAQHYAADWSDYNMRKALLNSMAFSHEEAAEETPVSACNVTLSVFPTVDVICALGVANFMNFWNGKALKKLVIVSPFEFTIDAF